MTDAPTLTVSELLPRRHPGLVLREEVHRARLLQSAEIRRAQRDAKAALAPALKDMGRQLRPAEQAKRLLTAGKVRPATRIAPEDMKPVRRRDP